jgi:membrane associated rhomboid family serine protease
VPRRSNFQIGWLQFNSTAAKLALGVVGGSLIAFLTKSSIGPWLHLSPGLVLRDLALWQPFTYSLIAGNPISVIFSALILVSVAGGLEATWGSRRLLSFAFGVTVAAGFLTVALSLVIPVGSLYTGAETLVTAVWVAYGLLFASRQTNFWGLPVTGYTFALIGIGFVVLSGVYYGWAGVIPEIIGIGLTYAYLRVKRPRDLLLRFQSWRLQRQLRGRAKHLRLITKDRNTPTDSDRYLH